MNRDLIRAAFTGENLVGFGLFIAGLICLALLWSVTPYP